MNWDDPPKLIWSDVISLILIVGSFWHFNAHNACRAAPKAAASVCFSFITGN